jgi:hypothetical protein
MAAATAQLSSCMSRAGFPTAVGLWSYAMPRMLRAQFWTAESGSGSHSRLAASWNLLRHIRSQARHQPGWEIGSGVPGSGGPKRLGLSARARAPNQLRLPQCLIPDFGLSNDLRPAPGSAEMPSAVGRSAQSW